MHRGCLGCHLSRISCQFKQMRVGVFLLVLLRTIATLVVDTDEKSCPSDLPYACYGYGDPLDSLPPALSTSQIVITEPKSSEERSTSADGRTMARSLWITLFAQLSPSVATATLRIMLNEVFDSCHSQDECRPIISGLVLTQGKPVRISFPMTGLLERGLLWRVSAMLETEVPDPPDASTVQTAAARSPKRLIAQDDVVFWMKTPSDEEAHARDAALRDDFFHWWYTRGSTWKRSTWMGVPIAKFSGDLLIYQEIMFRMKPRVVVEFGTLFGGSALWFVGVLAQIHADQDVEFKVLSVDITHSRVFARTRRNRHVELMRSSSTAPAVEERIRALRRQMPSNFMFVLDSNHHYTHVLAELQAIHPVLIDGDYIVVEDMYLDGAGNHSWAPHGDYDGGPTRAVNEFLSEYAYAYERPADYSFESKHGFSQCEGGILRRLS